MSIHQSIDMVRDDLAQYIFSDFVEEPHIDKRSSSEEDKDNTTPAQSRRKAQNRAAYVPPPVLSVLIPMLT